MPSYHIELIPKVVQSVAESTSEIDEILTDVWFKPRTAFEVYEEKFQALDTVQDPSLSAHGEKSHHARHQGQRGALGTSGELVHENL